MNCIEYLIMIYWILLIIVIYIIKYIRSYTYSSTPDISDIKWISVCGVSGSGKTTFCNKMIEKHPDMIYLDCDKMFFQECIGETRVFAKKLRKFLKDNKDKSIIVDGNYKAVRKEVWNRCDAIYYLDVNPMYRIKNVICREFWNWWNNQTNEIGRPANFPMLFFYALIKSNKSLVWHASGLDFHKKQLDEGVITYLKESQDNYQRHLEKRDERIKQGQTPKELQKEPSKITYLKGSFGIKGHHFESFIITVFTFYICYTVISF